jgi:Zn-dependent protease/predicted transcriptional regulator
MRYPSLMLGRWAGIPIRVGLGWVLVGPLLLLSLEPLFQSGPSPAWWPALIATLLLFLSTFLHELGHALTARRLGLEVRAIQIALLSSASQLSQQPERPEHEFLIALAGPLSNLLQAAAYGLLALVTAGHWQLVTGGLALTNLVIGAFTLLPGYPLDGGRMLRAIFWFLGDDLIGATRLTSTVGQVIGMVLIGTGIALAILADPAGGIALGLVGWSMRRAAINGFLMLVVQQTLARVQVADLMSRSFRPVSPQLTLDLFVGQYLLGQADQGFPVIQAETLVGLITVRDLRRFRINEWRSISVGQAMTPSGDLPPLKPGDPADMALNLLNQQHVDQLPVTEDGQCLGMVRRRDLLGYIQTEVMRRRRR